MLVMCEKPKTIEAIHQPVRSLLVARARMFWSSPRKRNSSGQAVKNKIPSETRGSDLNCDHCGSNSMKRIAWPIGMAIQAYARKKGRRKKVTRWHTPMEQPVA